MATLDRRAFLAGGASVLGGAAAPRPVDPEVVHNLAVQIDGYYAAEAALGPRAMIPSVLVQQDLLRQLLSAARGAVREALLRTQAAYSGLLTWLYQDAGELAAAARAAAVALDTAHRVGDRQLIRHTLTNKAMVCTDEGDALGTLDLTRAALRDETTLCAKVRVQALQQSAHGFAALGDRMQAERALDRAAALLPGVDDDYPWYNACRRAPAYVEAQRATCYNRLGLGNEAADLWQQVLTTLPATARRDRGVYLARQAAAYAQARQPDAAVGPLRSAAAIAVETGSARLGAALADAWRELRPWHDHPAVRAAREVPTVPRRA